MKNTARLRKSLVVILLIGFGWGEPGLCEDETPTPAACSALQFKCQRFEEKVKRFTRSLEGLETRLQKGEIKRTKLIEKSEKKAASFDAALVKAQEDLEILDRKCNGPAEDQAACFRIQKIQFRVQKLTARKEKALQKIAKLGPKLDRKQERLVIRRDAFVTKKTDAETTAGEVCEAARVCREGM